MQIGPYKLESNLLLAPMAGVTDKPFRQLCRRFGAGLAVSEMVSSDTSLWGTRKTVTRLDHRGEAAPVSVQIVGTDPRQMARAAQVNVEYGAQIIDINMGCPAKKVCKVAAGSALLRNESLVGNILKAVVNAVGVPVTLKIRTGWDPSSRNGVRIAQIAEQAGVQALAVHGRTRACRYQGDAEYDTIRDIKQAVSIPIIANGDVDSAEKAKKVLAYTHADAIMLGRAAQGRPWIFQQINHYLETGQRLAPPSPDIVYSILREHLESLYALYGNEHGVKVARKHIAWYSKQYPDSAVFRKIINQAKTTTEQIGLIQQYFNSLNQWGEIAA